MDLHELIRTRRTVHEFTPGPLPEGCIERAVEAAQWAPCHKLTWPWRFIRVGPTTREPLTELGIELKLAGNPGSDELRARVRAKLANPSALLVVTQQHTDDAFRSREDYGAIAAAIQNLSLSLWSEGVRSKWGTGGLTRHPKTYELLGIDRNTEEIVGFLWVGHPARTPKPPVRPSLADVLRELP